MTSSGRMWRGVVPSLVVIGLASGFLVAVAAVEARAGLPSERADLVGGERIAAVVTGPVGHVLDQRLVGAGELDQPADQVDVLRLVGPADVVDLARRALALNQ